jgi:hypothetical protein
MAAERSDRERFSHREAYERWTGDYSEPADNADQDDDFRVYPTAERRKAWQDKLALELLEVMAKNGAKNMQVSNAVMHPGDYARHSDVIVDEPGITVDEINRLLADDYMELIERGELQHGCSDDEPEVEV